MASVKITQSGEVPIPSDIRQTLGLKAGDVLDIRLSAEGTVELRRTDRGRPEATHSLVDLVGRLEPPRTGVTLEAMERAIAEGAASTGHRRRR